MTTTPPTAPTAPNSADAADFSKIESAAIESEDEAVIKRVLGVDLQREDLNDASGVTRRIMDSVLEIRTRLGGFMLAAPDEVGLTNRIEQVINGVRNNASEEQAYKLKVRGITTAIMETLNVADLVNQLESGGVVTNQIMDSLSRGSSNERGRILAASMINERPELVKIFEGSRPLPVLEGERDGARLTAEVGQSIDNFGKILKGKAPQRGSLADVNEFMGSIAGATEALNNIVLPAPPAPGAPITTPRNGSIPIDGNGDSARVSIPYTETPAGIAKANAAIETLKKELESEKTIFEKFLDELPDLLRSIDRIQSVAAGRATTIFDDVMANPDLLTRDIIRRVPGELATLRTILTLQPQAILDENLKRAEDAVKNFDPTKRVPQGDIAQRRVVVEYLKAAKGLSDAEAQQAANYLLVRTQLNAELAGAQALMRNDLDAKYAERSYVEPNEMARRQTRDLAAIAGVCAQLGIPQVGGVPNFAGTTAEQRLQAYYIFQRLFNGPAPDNMRLGRGAATRALMEAVMNALLADDQVVNYLRDELKDNSNPTIRGLYRKYVDRSINRREIRDMIEAYLSGNTPASLSLPIYNTLRATEADMAPRGWFAAGQGYSFENERPATAPGSTASPVPAPQIRPQWSNYSRGRKVAEVAIGTGSFALSTGILFSSGPVGWTVIPAALATFYAGRFVYRRMRWASNTSNP